jgi:hypothetical protein
MNGLFLGVGAVLITDLISKHALRGCHMQGLHCCSHMQVAVTGCRPAAAGAAAVASIVLLVGVVQCPTGGGAWLMFRWGPQISFHWSNI